MQWSSDSNCRGDILNLDKATVVPAFETSNLLAHTSIYKHTRGKN